MKKEWKYLKKEPAITPKPWVFQQVPWEYSIDNFSTYRRLMQRPSARKAVRIWCILLMPIILVGIYLFVRYVLYFMFAFFWMATILTFELYGSQHPLLNLFFFILCALPEVYLFFRCILVPIIAVIRAAITTHKNGSV